MLKPSKIIQYRQLWNLETTYYYLMLPGVDTNNIPII